MLNNLYSTKTIEMGDKNVSDHLSIKLKLNQPGISDWVCTLNDGCCIKSRARYSQICIWKKIQEKFVTHLFSNLEMFPICQQIKSFENCCRKNPQLLTDHSLFLVSRSPLKVDMK